MIKAEWRFLKRHKLMFGVLLVLMLVPMLYTTIFLSSMWNPYGKTKDLPVAVVNHDQAVTYQGTKLTVGKDLTKQLKKSDSLKFNFPKSEKAAKRGLKSGKYYMVITIPKNFSKNAATAFTSNPKKLKLTYTTNYGMSYVAGKMTASAAEKIANQVDTKLTKTYTAVMVAYLQKMQATLTTAAQSNTQLASALQSSSTSQLQLSKATVNQIASPVKTVHHDISEVANNGTAMAPYMLMVALYVGCLALNLMYDVVTPRKRPQNGTSWWAAKMSVVGTFAILQAVIAYGALVGFLGLKPVHPWVSLLVVVSISAAFANLVTLLNVAFGKVGSFLALLLMMFQLGGSAGTYPIELSNGFFMAIHQWLPASYAVHGLRESLMIGNSAAGDIWVLLGIAVISALLMIVAFRIRLKKLPDIEYEKISQ